VSTASRALNPNTQYGINVSTVERVLEASRRLRYRPHAMARGLRTNKTMTVGIVVPNLQNPMLTPIVVGADSVLSRAGYSTIVGNTDFDHSSHEDVLLTLLERSVDGFILCTASRADDLVSALLEENVPVVLANRVAENVAVPSVVNDDYTGMQLVVDHLVSLGHTQIGHISGPEHLSTSIARRSGFTSAIHSAGLVVDRDLIEEGDYDVVAGHAAARRLLERRPDLTAVVSANDLIALGVYKAARETGRKVGRDLSVTGYNDLAFMDMVDPPLTSVRVPHHLMGAESARKVISLIDGSAPPTAVTIQLTPTLSIRESTAPV
jgi:LacI family transcriptional regulator